jgi:hypothetical protein
VRQSKSLKKRGPRRSSDLGLGKGKGKKRKLKIAFTFGSDYYLPVMFYRQPSPTMIKLLTTTLILFVFTI